MHELRQKDDASLVSAPGALDVAIHLSALSDESGAIFRHPDLRHRNATDGTTSIGQSMQMLARTLPRHCSSEPAA